MKVLMINGSPHVSGNTALALKEMETIFREKDCPGGRQGHPRLHRLRQVR